MALHITDEQCPSALQALPAEHGQSSLRTPEKPQMKAEGLLVCSHSRFHAQILRSGAGSISERDYVTFVFLSLARLTQYYLF